MSSRARALADKFSPATATTVDDAVGGNTDIYNTIAELPLSGIDAGTQAYVAENNRLYIWTGSGWYNIALINTAPSITSGGAGVYTLATDGTPTVITLTAEDPEGLPITWSYTVTSGSLGSTATISQADNIFTITPSTDKANEGSFELTFTASDGVNIATDVNSFSLAFVSLLWDETVLSIGTNSTNGLANSTFIDRSTNAHTVTTSGSPIQTVFHPYLDNWSVEFDGNDYFQISATATDLLAETTDTTIEAWVNTTSTAHTAIFSNFNPSSPFPGMEVGLWNGYQTFYSNGSWVNNPVGTGVSTINDGVWHHLAWVITNNGATVTTYVDGVQNYSTSTNVSSGGGSNIRIGAASNSTVNRHFIGHISNFRFVKGTALYTANFTPPVEKLTAITNTALLTCLDNRFKDSSSNAYTPTIVGTPSISAYNPFGQLSEYAVGENKGSATFPSTGTKLELGEDPLFAFGTGDYTVEFWYYSNPSSGGTIWGTVFDTSTGAAYLGSLFITASPTAGQTLIVYQNGGTRASGTTSGKNLQAGEWTHCAVTRESGTINIWINGVLDGTGSGTEDLVTSHATIGGTTYWAGSYDMRDGDIISDLKVTKGTAVYTSTFTPPTSPIGSSNASLYLPFDNAGIYDKTGTNTIILGGDTSTSTTETKYASTSIKFDGTGDTAYIAGGASQKFNIGGITQWTAEFWCNTTAAGHQRLLTFHGPQNWGLIKPVAQTTGIEWNHFGPGAAFTSGAGTLPANTWTHVALVRNGSTITCYLNGTSAGSTTSIPTSGAYEVWIGSSTGSYARSDTNGYFENVQFLSGVAKYTTNFTPPTSTQGRQYQAES